MTTIGDRLAEALGEGKGQDVVEVSDEKAANWVDQQGGLPKYIKRIAKHLIEKGMTESHAIAVAVNVAKKMCATGDVNFPGVQQVNPGSRAEACSAVAQWEAMKARAHADVGKSLTHAEAKRLIIEKTLVTVPGYTRADGTRVGGYTYRREGGGPSTGSTTTSRAPESPPSEPEVPALPEGANDWPPKKGAVAHEVLGDWTDTQEKYSKMINGKRVYNPKRDALHQRIIAQFLKDEDGNDIRPDSSGIKKALMSIGGPASGKGSVVEPRRIKSGDGAMVQIDPDKIKEQLDEFKAMSDAKDPYSAFGVHEESSDVAKMLLAEAQRRGLNVFVDGVGDSERGKFKGKIDRLKKDKYQVTIVGMDLPPAEAQKRNIFRAMGIPGVQEGSGRIVPPAYLEQAYSSVPARHLEWREDPDLEWEMYSNDVPRGADPIEMARKARRSRKIERLRPDLYDDEFIKRAKGVE